MLEPITLTGEAKPLYTAQSVPTELISPAVRERRGDG